MASGMEQKGLGKGAEGPREGNRMASGMEPTRHQGLPFPFPSPRDLDTALQHSPRWLDQGGCETRRAPRTESELA
jgi:hypothetical protein